MVDEDEDEDSGVFQAVFRVATIHRTRSLFLLHHHWTSVSLVSVQFSGSQSVDPRIDESLGEYVALYTVQKREVEIPTNQHWRTMKPIRRSSDAHKEE